jgi:hypothetical protein
VLFGTPVQWVDNEKPVPVFMPSGRFSVRDFLRRGFPLKSRVCATRKRRKRRAPAARAATTLNTYPADWFCASGRKHKMARWWERRHYRSALENFKTPFTIQRSCGLKSALRSLGQATTPNRFTTGRRRQRSRRQRSPTTTASLRLSLARACLENASPEKLRRNLCRKANKPNNSFDRGCDQGAMGRFWDKL